MKKNIILANAVLITVLFMISMIERAQPSGDDWEVPSKYAKLKNPYSGVKDSDQIGRRLYAIHCKSCHGSKGKGDGSKSKELKTAMPDFTTSEFKSQADGVIYYKTYVGRDEMPAFEKKINNEEDQWLLVNYIKTL